MGRGIPQFALLQPGQHALYQLSDIHIPNTPVVLPYVDSLVPSEKHAQQV